MLPFRSAMFSARRGPDYAFVENLSGVAETNEDVVELAAISDFLTDAGGAYLVIGSTTATCNSTTGAADIILNVDGGGFESSATAKFSESAPADVRGLSSIYVFEGAGQRHTFAINGQNQIAATTTTFANTRLFILKLGPNDHWISGASTTTTSTTAEDMLTLGFTPPSARDYLLIGYAAVGATNAANRGALWLNDGSSDVAGIFPSLFADILTRSPCLLMHKMAGISGAQTVKLRKSTTAGTGTMDYPVLVALDLSRFADAQFVRRTGTDFTGNTTYQAAITQTFTPVAGDYLFLAALAGFGSGTISSYMRAVDGGTTVAELIQENAQTVPGQAMRVATYTAASRTQTIDQKAESGSHTSPQNANAIISLSLSGLTAA